MTKFPVVVLILCLTITTVSFAACSPSSVTGPTVSTSPTKESPVPTQAQSPVATVSESQAPAEGLPTIPAPEEGRASVGGTLYTFSADAPIPGTVFYLTPPRGETDDAPRVLSGPNEEQGDIRGQSDAEGHFILSNVSPGSYYLAVWAPYDWILAVESPTDQTPRLITLQRDQRENLGRVYLAWP